MLDTPQVLRIDAFEDSGVSIRILGETKAMWQWAVMGELRKRLKKTFDEEGIEIPWPHTRVYIDKTPRELKRKEGPTPPTQPGAEVKGAWLPPPSEGDGGM